MVDRSTRFHSYPDIAIIGAKIKKVNEERILGSDGEMNWEVKAASVRSVRKG